MAVKDKGGTAAPRSGARLWFWRIVKIGAATSFFGLIALVVAVATVMGSLPSFNDLKSSPNGQMILVKAADGTEIMQLGPSFGEWLDIEDIPQVMKDAMISVEDRRFAYHPGVDVIGIGRAIFTTASGGGRLRATSTITQQLARNIFLSNSRSYTRKIREGILALALEQKFSKDQILELYLNKVYFGGGAYGVDSASRKFFNHDATTLSLAEAAIIAGLVKAPSRYSPTADSEAAIGRAGVVLQVMQDVGTITPAQAAEADLDAVKFAPEKGQNSVRYFTDWALPQLDTLIEDNDEPIVVWTTLDLNMQRAGTNAIQAYVPGGAQGALVALDRDGAVRAMVGGTDYVTSNYNRAVSALRQPGSAWKLFVYMAALEAGYKPEDIVTDAPITIGGWTPRNSGGSYAGDISLRTAFAYSKNTVAARIGEDVGTSTIANMARRFGITTPITTLPSMVLGSSEVRVIDMVRAFAGVSSGGVAIAPYGITKVTTGKGELLYQHEADMSQVLVPPYVTAGMTDLLQTAVNVGTGRAAQIGRPVAGKTGTTNSNKDGWFLGFSSGITTGVWMGRDDARPVGGLQGGTAPARAFAAFMKVAVAKRKIEPFETELTLPESELEPDDEAYFGSPDDVIFIDENGNPVGQGEGISPPQTGGGIPGEAQQPERLDENFIDRALGRDTPPQRPQVRQAEPRPPVRRPPPNPQEDRVAPRLRDEDEGQ
ncbi:MULTISPECIES: PBP1A family penicillin-binding protein [Pseudomonadota]|jgi:penicillin-binding protein 1A|uniref:transglycosylase domain-containing protein n=1 Tax=Pseudomonadota TaxID=1224 RepID=UPI00076ABD96|nr:MULTISPECIES: PBP1A family penicillin-binding protein [Pseudomonadota]MAF62417.1 penicillin-binding protein [Blastomonas sp.]|tara:strand:+ start:115283 stop:117421 length:2139 start_codon:yes stop_codon:yes gene_type:complete